MSHQNDIVSTHSLTEETTGTLTSPPPELPTLPFDVMPEILCRLPVKLLVQLRCLCKFFNSLISDPNFAKKHLQFSTKRHHLTVISHDMSRDDDEVVQFDFPIPSVISTSTVFTQTRLYPPNTLTDGRNYVSLKCSCDGIFCGVFSLGSNFLWNPSIRKFKLLPPLPWENLCKGTHFSTSFVYDRFIDNYKVIVSKNNEVCIYTLGTDYWRRIEDFPYHYDTSGLGIFVSGTVNWLTSDNSSMRSSFILSLDLEKESYQELSLPNIENKIDWWSLGVVRDCLCVFGDTDMFWGVWIMKEYGNEKSWTELYTVPIHTMRDRGLEAFEALYISEDGQLLVQCYEIEGNIKLVVYDSKTGALNIPEFQNNYYQMNPQLYIESLISP